MISTAQKRIIQQTLSSFKPIRIGVFGSYARNEENPQSDLDVLVDFSSRYNLLDLIGMQDELTELLGMKVDLVTEKSLNPSLKEQIQRDVIWF